MTSGLLFGSVVGQVSWYGMLVLQISQGYIKSLNSVCEMLLLMHSSWLRRQGHEVFAARRRSVPTDFSALTKKYPGLAEATLRNP